MAGDPWGRETRHDLITCPHCGHELNASTHVNGADAPGPGMVSVCIYCAGVSVFGDGLELRPPTWLEAVECSLDPGVQRCVAAVLEALHDAHGGAS